MLGNEPIQSVGPAEWVVLALMGAMALALAGALVRRWLLQRAGYGVDALRAWAPLLAREVRAQVRTLPQWDDWALAGPPVQRYVEVTLAHAGAPSVVAEHRSGRSAAYEPAGFTRWLRGAQDPRETPDAPAAAPGRLTPDALGALEALAGVRGVLVARLEPGVVRVLLSGDLLPPTQAAGLFLLMERAAVALEGAGPASATDRPGALACA